MQMRKVSVIVITATYLDMTFATTANITGEPMDDLISRQAAIAVADSSDYVGLSVEDVKKVTDEVVKGLKQLPSAEPEKRTEERTETHACDCISRQAAIDALQGRK